ncbi:RraA family protein|uniref:RraA family protein n=1 Tax=Pseudomonas sp. SbOxS1 TaxID=2723884 RepID=UPI0015D44A86|nr:RraA family protein [Pseudomonas sp. SbOxS1]NYU05159.1 RraA family protein [Pseudomonas sp. SbOxS1]
MFDFKQLSKELYSAVLSDVMDDLGLTSQAMRPFVRPVDDQLVMMGRVRTGLFVDTYSVREGENPYAVEIALLDDLKPGEVPVLACNGPTNRIAPWGELLTTASKARGAVGCVTDGLVRDVRHIKALQFPVFHGGIGPLDSRGRARMTEMDTPVECGGVKVRSGDIIFGDIDGVVIIPQERAAEVIELARIKVNSENNTRDELREGKFLRDVYEKYGVL